MYCGRVAVEGYETQTHEDAMTFQSKTPNGLDKISRYNWKMQDSPGVLANVKKTDILFDHEYQRSQNKAKILEIAKNWSWLAMGVITIADRGGQLYAVDGMHRVSAALLRSDIETVPCIIFKTSDVREEATGFVQANTLRKPISTFDKHRALLVAGDETAALVERLLDDGGFEPSTNSSKKNGVKCYGILHKLAKNKRDALLSAWPLVCAVCNGRMLSERILEGLVLIEAVGSEKVSSKKWSNIVLSVGFDALLDGAQSAAAYYSRGGAKVWADGMLQVINKGRRHRLELK